MAKIIDNTPEKQGPPTLNTHGIYFLNGDINDANCGGAIQFILENNLDPECNLEYLTLIINSYGGYTNSGFALVDAMLGSKIPVRTVGIGALASMGLMIFIAGEKGTRKLTKRCMILSHEWSGFSYGKQHELLADQKKITLLQKIVLDHYVQCTGLKKKEVKEKLLPPSDVWLSAEEAKKLGICDLVADI